MATLMITAEIYDGETWYKTEARGVAYSLHYCKSSDSWDLYSKRKSIASRTAVGSLRVFDSLQDLEKKVKLFSGISKLLGDNNAIPAVG